MYLVLHIYLTLLHVLCNDQCDQCRNVTTGRALDSTKTKPAVFRELCSGKDNQYLLHSLMAVADVTFNQVYLKRKYLTMFKEEISVNDCCSLFMPLNVDALIQTLLCVFQKPYVFCL